MKVPAIISCVAMGAALCLAPLAEAHHSNSAFYVTKVITIKGRRQGVPVEQPARLGDPDGG